MLHGMLTVTVRAQADLSNKSALFRAVTYSGGFALNGREAAGILLSGNTSGGAVTVGVVGWSKFFAGLACSFGAPLMVLSGGYFAPMSITNYEVGLCTGVEGSDVTSPNSGSLGAGFFNFANKPYALPLSMGAFI
jgi:hypothetical protein